MPGLLLSSIEVLSFGMVTKKLSGGKREYRKYREELYIPHRYILYSYWHQFLKIAHQEKKKLIGKNIKTGELQKNYFLFHLEPSGKEIGRDCFQNRLQTVELESL